MRLLLFSRLPALLQTFLYSAFTDMRNACWGESSFHFDGGRRGWEDLCFFLGREDLDWDRARLLLPFLEGPNAEPFRGGGVFAFAALVMVCFALTLPLERTFAFDAAGVEGVVPCFRTTGK
jgi:hypothetical protein